MNSSIMIAIVQKDRQISTFWFHKQNVQGKLNMQLQVKCIQHKKKLLKRKKWWKTCASLIPISEVVLNEKFYQRLQFKNFAIVLYRYTKKCQHSSMNEKKNYISISYILNDFTRSHFIKHKYLLSEESDKWIYFIPFWCCMHGNQIIYLIIILIV